MAQAQRKNTELITEDDATILRQLAGLHRKEDSGGGVDQMPILKINYDPEAEVAPGEWVVGQKKDTDGNIVDQGYPVAGLITVIIRKRYSFYNQLDTNKNCSSPIFVDSDVVCGSKYGYNCKSGECPHREKNVLPRCKAQWVLFGLAITDKGKLIDCMSYVQGTSYMPFDEFRNKITRAKLGSGYLQVPPFSYIVNLGTKRLKNGGSTYYQIDFQKGRMLSGADEVRICTDRQEKFSQLIEALNSKVTSSASKVAPSTAQAEAQKAFSQPAPDSSPEPDFSGINAFGAKAKAEAEAATDVDDSIFDAEYTAISEDVPKNLKTTIIEGDDEFDGGSDDDVDIEAEVQRAIAGMAK